MKGNKRQMIQEYEKAQKAIEKAIAHIEKAYEHSPDWGYRGTAQHFKYELEELLSTDHHEAGLIPFLETIK